MSLSNLSFLDLRIALTLVESGSSLLTAELLSVPRSSVHTVVHKLEESYGPLFERGRGVWHPVPKMWGFSSEASSAISTLDRARKIVSTLNPHSYEPTRYKHLKVEHLYYTLELQGRPMSYLVKTFHKDQEHFRQSVLCLEKFLGGKILNRPRSSLTYWVFNDTGRAVKSLLFDTRDRLKAADLILTTP